MGSHPKLLKQEKKYAIISISFVLVKPSFHQTGVKDYIRLYYSRLDWICLDRLLCGRSVLLESWVCEIRVHKSGSGKQEEKKS